MNLEKEKCDSSEHQELQRKQALPCDESTPLWIDQYQLFQMLLEQHSGN